VDLLHFVVDFLCKAFCDVSKTAATWMQYLTQHASPESIQSSIVVTAPL
jgi:hypothetical protein